ncbi:MAG: purine-nucleoside phosphorylase [Lachnospiraceae bacterium]|nr:purine-nucleoside phosphorylase [Lachnospiraceae bacterium]
MTEAKKPYPTPHIDACPDDFAKTVLMPGDPLRSKLIAETFLEDAKLVNNVRGVQGYTGVYKGTKVSVMASGMGMPSMAIYSYELFNIFGVDNIIRIGSAGGISDKLNLRDIIVAMSCSTDSNYINQFDLPGIYAPTASYELACTAVDKCKQIGAKYHVGNILTSDTFYNDKNDRNMKWDRMGVLAVEMETAALYCNAARAGKRALAICTVSDHVMRGESLTAKERQESFTEMMEVALQTAVSLDKPQW